MARSIVGVRRLVPLAVLLIAVIAGGALPVATAGAAGGKQSACTGRKPCPAPADTTAPTASVATPAPGATVSGTVSVTGTAADNVSVAKVEMAVDGGAFQLATGTTNWSRPLDTTAYTNATHTVTARVTDASGNTATAGVTVTVANAMVDSTVPTVSMTTPSAGATVSGTVSVAGTAADNASVARVEVAVDGGAFQLATGTTNWSRPLDTTAYANASHTITARATDASGNTATAGVTVTVANGTSADDVIVTDPAATHALSPLGRTRMPQWGSLTGVLYAESVTNRRGVFVRDGATGSTSAVTLPTDNLYGWSNAAAVMTSAADLWVFGGSGPLYLRHYQLSGAPLPASATLMESRTFGDSDSREGDMLKLGSGVLVVAWHQQGATGPQGQFVAYRSPAGAWAQLSPLAFMPTRASDQVLVQHPADGSVWLFSSPDAWDAIGAVHLTESAATLRIDWTDGLFIDQQTYGLNGPDPEDPNLAGAPDAATGTIALAYQSADRQRFFVGSQTETASRVAVARIGAAGAISFDVAPVWAERVSAIGLTVLPGETTVSYRPLDPATLAFDDVYVIRHRGGGWESPLRLGTLDASTSKVTYATGAATYSTKLADGRIHLWPL